MSKNVKKIGKKLKSKANKFAATHWRGKWTTQSDITQAYIEGIKQCIKSNNKK